MFFFRKDNIGEIKHVNKDGRGDVSVFKTDLGMQVQDLQYFRPRPTSSLNPCVHDNGGCDELCYHVGGGQRECGCAHGQVVEETKCKSE